MKELDFRAGEHINRCCERLVAAAPAWTEFNGVRIEAMPGDRPGDLFARWDAEMKRKADEWHASPEYKAQQEQSARRKVVEDQVQAEAVRKVAASGVRERHPWTDAMGEISGFGGGYEQACRGMVYAGLAWFQERPRDLSTWETDDAKALDRELLAAEPGCSGAMHGACMNAVAFIAKNGWGEYVSRMTTRTTASRADTKVGAR